MTELENIKFKNDWDQQIEKMFWYKLKQRNVFLELLYFFDFGTLKSEIRKDENNDLYLCYSFKARFDNPNISTQKTRNLNIQALRSILMNIFGNNANEKYIGFYKLKQKGNFKDFLRALFVLGNEKDFKDGDLKKIC